jgi:ATP-dependent DNA helicase RecQ
MQLSHEDVNLGYFEFVQHRFRNILSGDSLTIKELGCANSNGDLVLKFSKKFLETMERIERNGYELKSAKVNFVVYWQNEETKKEVKIILPELYFEKKQDDSK